MFPVTGNISSHFPKFHSNVQGYAKVNRMARNLNVGRKRDVVARHHVNHSDCRCFWLCCVWVIARPRALGCVSVRSLIGLHVRVPKRNTDFIYPLVYADRSTGRRTRRVELAAARQFDTGCSVAIPEAETAKSSGRLITNH